MSSAISSLRAARALLFCSVAAAGLAAADKADAQTTSPDPAAAAQEPEAETGGITDIVVTAQRREESLQDVPLSVTAITGQELRNADLRDITRLEQAVPGLRVGRSGPAARPAIRGVYTEAIQANSDPRIGFYIDEIYQSRTQQTTAAFVDLERVEVQKGPQGTLFGRNSLGGNIALTSARPRDTFDGGVGLTVGNYNRVRVEGFVNLPITGTLALRVAAAADRHDPIFRSVVSRAGDFGDLGYQFVRGTLLWEPAGGRLEVLLRGSYLNQDDRGYASFNAKNLGALVDTSLIRAPGQSVTFNGQTYPLPFGFNGGNYATGRLVPFSPVFRDNIPDINGADIGLPSGGPYDVLFDFKPTNRIKAKNLSAAISFDLSDNVRLRSITGYTDFFFYNIADGDGGPIPLSSFYFINEAETYTQELQIQSADPSSPFQYTLGAFYMNDTVYEAASSVFSQTSYSTATAAGNGQPVLYASGSTCGFSFSPLNAPFSCLLNNAASADGASPTRAKTESYAGYGQVSYRFGDRLTLTGGLRYTVDKKDYRSVAQVGGNLTAFVGTFVAAQNAAAIAAGRPAPFPNAAGYRAVFPFNEDRARFANFECGGLTPGDFAAAGSNVVVGTVPNYFLTRCGQRDFKFWTYRVAADYQVTPDNLLYLSYSTGVRSGGFGAPFTPTDIPQGVFATFDKERARAIELGSKNSFFDRRLQVNAAIFYNKYFGNQVQGTQFVQTGNNTGVNIATIANIGDTEAPGAELTIVAQPTSRLTVRAAVQYLRARNSIDPQGIFASGLCTISTAAGPCGAPGSPERIRSQAGVGSGFFPNPQTNPELFVPIRDAAGNIVQYGSIFFGEETRVQNTPDWTGNFGVSYEIPVGGSATLTPEVDVLFSDNYILSATAPQFKQEAYAKIDARITLRLPDDRLSVQAFVQNLTDQATLGRITTGTLSAQGTYAEPRRFGFRVGYNF